MDYMIDSTNLNKVEGTKKSDYDSLAQRVGQAENTLNGVGNRVTALEEKVWALAGSMNTQQAANLDISVSGKSEIFLRIDTGKTSTQGKYNIGFYLPVLALDGTSASERLTLTTVQSTASGHITVDAFIYSANVVRFNTVRLNGGSLDVAATLYAYTR